MRMLSISGESLIIPFPLNSSRWHHSDFFTFLIFLTLYVGTWYRWVTSRNLVQRIWYSFSHCLIVVKKRDWNLYTIHSHHVIPSVSRIWTSGNFFTLKRVIVSLLLVTPQHIHVPHSLRQGRRWKISCSWSLSVILTVNQPRRSHRLYSDSSLFESESEYGYEIADCFFYFFSFGARFLFFVHISGKTKQKKKGWGYPRIASA